VSPESHTAALYTTLFSVKFAKTRKTAKKQDYRKKTPCVKMTDYFKI